MNILLLVLPCLYWLSLCECYYVNPNCPLGITFQKCDSDEKGHSYYSCLGKDENKKSGGSERCPDNHICKCHMPYHVYAENPAQKCNCVDPAKPAPFPAVGRIRWEGTYDDGFTVNLKGEVYKDRSGNYLMSKINYLGRKELEILIPNGDGSKFFQYTYSNAEKKLCEKKEVASEKYLHSIWEKKGDYVLKSEEKKGDKVTQIWKRDRSYNMWEERAKMTVEYNSTTHVAIPVKYYFNEYDYKNMDEYTRIDYSYESLGKGETTFKVEDYCSNQ